MTGRELSILADRVVRVDYEREIPFLSFSVKESICKCPKLKFTVQVGSLRAVPAGHSLLCSSHYLQESRRREGKFNMRIGGADADCRTIKFTTFFLSIRT